MSTPSAKRILLVSYHFPPSSAVGARRPARLARGLPAHGFDVDVVCAEIDGGISTPDPTQLELLDESTRILRVDTPFVFGRHPTRPPPPGFNIDRLWWKARAYVEEWLWTTDWSWSWGTEAVRRLDAELRREDYELVILNVPPRPAVAPFAEWAVRQRLPVVVDLRDVWAGSVESWPWWWFASPTMRRRRWYVRLRNAVLESAAHIVTNTPEMAEFMSRRVPLVPPDRFSSITNAYESLDDVSEPDATGGPPYRIVHTGSLAYGRASQAAALVRALGVLARRGGPDVEFIQAGAGGEDLPRIAAEEGVSERVIVHSWLDRPEAVALQRSASALALFQTDGLSSRCAVPAKLFEYMSRRKPVLALVAGGPSARIVRECVMGEASSSTEPESVANVVEALVRRMEEAPVAPPPPDRYSEESTVAEFAAILKRVIDEAAVSCR